MSPKSQMPPEKRLRMLSGTRLAMIIKSHTAKFMIRAFEGVLSLGYREKTYKTKRFPTIDVKPTSQSNMNLFMKCNGILGSLSAQQMLSLKRTKAGYP